MTKIKLKEDKPISKKTAKRVRIEKIPFHVNTKGFCDLYSQKEIDRLLGYDPKTRKFVSQLNSLLGFKNTLEFLFFSFLFIAKYFYFFGWGISFGYVADFLSEFFHDMDRNLFNLLFRILIVCIFGFLFVILLVISLLVVTLLKRLTMFAMELIIAKKNRASRKKKVSPSVMDNDDNTTRHLHNSWKLESDFILRIEKSEDDNNLGYGMHPKITRILSLNLDEQTRKQLEDETLFAFKEVQLLKDLDEISFFDHYSMLIKIVKFWQKVELTAQILLVVFFTVIMLSFVFLIILVVLFDVEKERLKEYTKLLQDFNFDKLDWGVSITIYASSVSFLSAALIFYDCLSLMRTLFESIIMKKCEKVVQNLNKNLKYSDDHRFYGLRTESTTNIFGDATRRELVYFLEVFRGEQIPSLLAEQKVQQERRITNVSEKVTIKKDGALKVDAIEAEVVLENGGFIEPVTYHSHSYAQSYINTKGVAVPLVLDKEKQRTMKNQNLSQDDFYDEEEMGNDDNNMSGGFYQIKARDDSRTPLTPGGNEGIMNAPTIVNPDSYFEHSDSYRSLPLTAIPVAIPSPAMNTAGGDRGKNAKTRTVNRNENSYLGYGTTGSTPPHENEAWNGEMDES